MRTRILIVDDEDTIRKLLKSRLEREGFETALAATADEGDKLLTSFQDISVVITDLKMPGRSGLEFLAELKEKSPQLRTIMITGHGEKDVAVQALKKGASDYLEKPFDLDELTHAVRRCVSEYNLERENKDLLERLEARVERVEGKAEDAYWFVSKDSSMAKVNEWLTILRRESMRGNAEEPSVLILGDSGTGKEGVARMVHAGSRRAKGPWVALNCANFNEQLLESELFGHEKGAFTGATSLKRGLFEIAKGGTLFLDEVGEMDIKLQARLLRVLQERVFRRVGGTVDLESDVRVVAATNQNLSEKVTGGSFREDLYHRLSRVVVEVPSLKNRASDILPMAKEFAMRAFSKRGKSFSGFTSEAEQALTFYSWPGNVRELLNVIERVALVFEGTNPVSPQILALPETKTGGHLGLLNSPFQPPQSSNLEGYMELKKKWSNEFEKEYLTAALNRHGGNVSAAAREAQLDRSNFLRLLRRHALRAEAFRKVA